MNRATNVRRLLPVWGATALVALQLFALPARADEASVSQLQAKADQALAQIEDATQAYQDAKAEVESLSAQIAQNEEKSADLEAKLPEQRERTAASVRNLYIFQQSTPGLLALVLSADNFNDFITTLRYIDAIQQHNTAQIEALTSLENELATTQATLSAELDTATAKQSEAMVALDTVRATRESLQAQVDNLRAEQARNAAAQQSEALKVAEDAAKAANEAVADLPQEARQATAPSSSGSQSQEATQEAPAQTTQTQEQEPAQTQEEAAPQQTAPTSTSDPWAARIDAYLAGSPLAGYGSVFAEAAAAYGVDPRVSPAIACIESGKGSVCFRPYNAWGWGNSGWSDWNSAIYAHVSGFASGYGSTVTLEGARKYCPPTYQTWYNLVWAEMNKI